MGGRVIKPEEIKIMTSDMKMKWFTLGIKMNALKVYLNSLIDSEELKGKTAENFKTQMKHHLSVINGIINEIYTGNKYCESLENEIGFADLIEDDIISQIYELEAKNRQLDINISKLDAVMDNQWCEFIFERDAMALKSAYYNIILYNKRMIEILNQKLQKIDDIEASVKNLFDTGGIANVRVGIKALGQGFSETDFVPVVYPAIRAISYLGSLKREPLDIRGIRTGLNEDFVTVQNDDGTPLLDEKGQECGFGGPQGILDSDISDKACGVVATVNTYLYLTGQTTISKSEYIKLCEQYCDEHRIDDFNLKNDVKFAALPPSMGNYIEEHCRLYGISDISTSWNWYKGIDQYDTMKQMLGNNIPVIISIYSRNELNFYEFKDGGYVDYDSVTGHYVVATAVYEKQQSDGSLKRMVEVSSWGKRLYFDYDEYLDCTKSFLQKKLKYFNNDNNSIIPFFDLEALINTIGSNILEIKID